MEIIYEKPTARDFEGAVEQLKKALKEREFGVLWEMSFKDKLQERGQDFDKNFVILEVCNPAKAKTVLDQRLEAGYMLPCKMAVYEKDGQVLIGMLKPQTLVELMGDEELAGVATEVEETLKAAIGAAL